MGIFKNKKPIRQQEQEKAIKFIDTFRKKYVPKNFNQIELLNHLFDENIHHYMSISSRTDGKSFNYIGAIMALAAEGFNIKFQLIARHYTLRKEYFNLLMKICTKIEYFDPKMLSVQSSDFYLIVFYGDNVIGIITDVDHVSDLKYSSAFLADFKLVIYDEFLARKVDYLPTEASDLKSLIESINRDFEPDETSLLTHPKIMYLGNAVNFDSPLLAYYDMFSVLEKHKINTLRVYNNNELPVKIALEMRRNDANNQKRNIGIFPDEENDSMSTGEFTFNTFALVNDTIRKAVVSGDYYEFNIKLLEYYLNVRYNYDREIYILSIRAVSDNYLFCTEVSDVKEGVIFLKDSFYAENQAKKHVKGLYQYNDAFTKNYVTMEENYINLKLMKLIGIHYEQNKKEQLFDKKERQYKDQYMENTKRSIIQKFWSQI